jgi:hypothetical protein
VFFPNALTDGVPKVPEALRVPFWHFSHCLTLSTLNQLKPGEARWNNQYIGK